MIYNNMIFLEGTMKKTLFVLCFLFAMLFLIGCRKAITVTVTFESNGGSEIPAIEFDGKSELATPEDPVRAGYRFEGWYLDENYECHSIQPLF
jgi:hypothetical protein